MTKPFSLAVFGRAFRSFGGAAKKQASRIYEIGELRLDFEKLLFYRGEEELSLSRNEQKLLRLFVENQGSFCQRERLIERLWDEGGEFVDENALSVTVNRLRRKLGAAEKGCDHIRRCTARGISGKRALEPEENCDLEKKKLEPAEPDAGRGHPGRSFRRVVMTRRSFQTGMQVEAVSGRFCDFRANLEKEKENIKSMISDISHQTKTPVANIRLYAELLGKVSRTARRRKLSGIWRHRYRARRRSLTFCCSP